MKRGEGEAMEGYLLEPTVKEKSVKVTESKPGTTLLTAEYEYKKGPVQGTRNKGGTFTGT